MKFPTDDGDFVYVEMDEAPEITEIAGGMKVRVSTKAEEVADKKIYEVATKFEKALGPIKRIADSVVAQIRQIANSPSEVAVEFGLKFNAEAGIVLSKVSTEANITISLVWKKETGPAQS